MRARRVAAANAALGPAAITRPHAMPIRNGVKRAVVWLEVSPWPALPQMLRTAAVGALRRRGDAENVAWRLPRWIYARTPCGADRHPSV